MVRRELAVEQVQRHLREAAGEERERVALARVVRVRVLRQRERRSDAEIEHFERMPRPGEGGYAHHGLLFLDELPEFARNVLELLRQPLEDSSVTIARASMTLCFPSNFMLVAAMNPCPCRH